MNDYNTTQQALSETIGAAEGQWSGSITDMDHLDIDQRLKALEVSALLSISQELSSLNPQNTTSRDEDGTERNGWGTVIGQKKS